MNIPIFKIRASALGQIMTNDRSGKGMGKTAQTYCETWLKEQLYGRQREFQTKYTDKGNICEDNSLDYVAEHLGYGMLIKNDRFLENDYMAGTPDVILSDHIIDVKNSWDCFTFPLFESEVPNKDYEWQLQEYMILADKPFAKLIYVLSDTPEHLIEREARYYAKMNGYDELSAEMLAEFTAKMTYPNIAPEHRIKVFHIKRNPDAEAQIIERVMLCRTYINNLLLNIKKQ